MVNTVHTCSLLVCFGFVLVLSENPIGSTCAQVDGEVLHVSFVSQRNRTGYWNTQIEMRHTDSNGLLEARETLPFSIDVKQIKTSPLSRGGQTVVLKTTISVPPKIPGPDYELFPGIGYYKLHGDVAVWSRAREVCVEEGTHLAIVNSEEEAAIMKKIFARYTKFSNSTSNDYAYIGFHDHENEGQFVTIFGDPLEKIGFVRWFGSEPNMNGANDEDCGLIHREGTLADVTCQWRMAFFCEQELS